MKLMDTEAASIYLALSMSFLEKLRVRGEGPKIVRIGRAIRYRQDDLDAFVSERVE